jgi:DNA repair exonuclease SbcCD ATPase subunit
MNIEFEYIEIQNFKSIGELQIFNFKELTGLTYVYGSNIDAPQSRNGSGKSTYMVDSIIFALFGRTLKNTNNKYIPNRYCDSSLKSYTKLYFSVDGQRYSSECYCKPKIGTVGMELLKYNIEADDWEDITQSSVIKTRQYIQENILGCSFELFKTAIIVAASDCMNFYENMGKQAKRNFVENIFNLNCFGIMFADIKSDLNNLKKELTYTNNEIVKSTQRLEQLKVKYENFDNQLNENINELKEELLSNYQELKKEEAELSVLSAELVEYDILASSINQLHTNNKTLTKAKHLLEKEILEIEYQIKSINDVLEHINIIKSGLCETCIEVINALPNIGFNDNNEKITQLNENLKVKNNKLKLVVDKLEIDLEKEETESAKLNLLQEKKLQENRITYKIQSLTDNIKKLKVEYDKLRNDQSNPFYELMTKTTQELESLKVQMIKYVKDIKHLEILRDACSENGVKRFIIKDIVKLLNSLIQKYLNEIGAEYLVYFDESFEFKFITMNGECEFSNFSTGERQRIQISTILAFRDLILNGKINSNIFVIDEFLDSGIDAIAIKNILNILNKKSIESNQNIFIISHRQETTESVVFNHIIEVIKENGKSTLRIN